MDKSIWDRIQELKESINGGVQPMDYVRLETRIIKTALAGFLIQILVMALWWSVKDHAVYPWLFFVTGFLWVGWIWNKVTDSWKNAGANPYQHVQTHDPESSLLVPENDNNSTYSFQSEQSNQTAQSVNHPLRPALFASDNDL